MFLNIIYLFTFIFSINICVSKRYDNYSLYRVIPVNNSTIEFFSKLGEFYDIDYWRSPGSLYRPIEFVIQPKDQPSFLRDAERQGIYLTTVIRDVQDAFDRQTVKSDVREQSKSFDWKNYFRLDVIYDWLTDAAEKYPNILTLQNIGNSHENRRILAVSILHEGGDNRPKIIMEGGIHAREWISTAFVTYVINEILHANSSKNEVLRSVARAYEWYFVPVLNVDGYEYTHTGNRLWRKNRHGGGVDLNRNFDHAYGTIGVSHISKSPLYCGEKAFSEKESNAMADYVKSKSEKLKYYLAFHAYGQHMVLPYANSTEHHENFEQVYKTCEIIAQKIAVRYNTTYDVGTAFDTVGYATSGVSGCWVKSTFKVPYVITFELRDKGLEGFALSPELITPTCEETMDGLIELLDPKRPEQSSASRVCLISMKIILVVYVTLIVIRH